MTAKKKEEEKVDVDLTEGIPAELGGNQQNEHEHAEGSYTPATRQSLVPEETGGAVALDLEGVRPPYLQLAHGVGELAENYNPGDLVLAKEHCLVTKGEHLNVVILNVEQYYKERIDQDAWNAGERPRLFRNKQEAAEAGLQVAWVDGQGPEASPAMDLTLLIRKPKENTCPLFSIDIGDDDEYALALLSSDKQAYRVLINDIALIINNKLARTGIYSGLWEFWTELSRPAKKTGNRTQIIRAAFKGVLPEETVARIREALAVPANVPENDDE